MSRDVAQHLDSEQGTRAAEARRAASKKRTIKGLTHPTTSDMEYTEEEWEFMQAMQAFKRASGRQFPTVCDYLRVLTEIGYRKPLCVADLAFQYGDSSDAA